MSAAEKWSALVARGCLCGTEEIASCPVHREPSDLRGIAAYLKAGSPRGFPLKARCSICTAPALLYPSVALNRGEVPAGEAPGPTLVCPRCSLPGHEQALRTDAEAFGYKLHDRAVFGVGTC